MPVAPTVHESEALRTELIRQAAVYTRYWVEQVRGAPDKLLAGLETHFGRESWLVIREILAAVVNDEGLSAVGRSFIQQRLSPEALRTASSGRRHTMPREGTVDELFRRAVAHRRSAAFIDALDFVSRLREYAPYNNWLVHLQRPKAVYWAREGDWRLRFRRTVRPDAVPIVMLQPMGPIMLVYDLEDTEGEPLPEHLTKPFATKGVFNPAWLTRVLEAAERLGIEVRRPDLSSRLAGRAHSSGGGGESNTFVIEVNRHHRPAEQFVTFCHELAHVLLGHIGGHAKRRWPSRVGLTRTQQELEAEGVAFIVGRRLGLLSYSAEYLAGHLSRQEDLQEISVDMIVKVAGRIEGWAVPHLKESAASGGTGTTA
jgi:hypothetical protein